MGQSGNDTRQTMGQSGNETRQTMGQSGNETHFSEEADEEG